MKILVSLSAARREEHFRAAFSGLGAELRFGYLPTWEEFDALILAGGGDLAPEEGEEESLFREVDPLRDGAERHLFWRCLLAGRPVLGICRGHQAVARFLGGRLIPHLETAVCHQGEGDRWHRVRVMRGSFLSSRYGREALVNSAHHQGVARLGAGMLGAAVSGDGLWEASEHPRLPVRSVQWHPERMADRREFFMDFLAWVKKEGKGLAVRGNL